MSQATFDNSQAAGVEATTYVPSNNGSQSDCSQDRAIDALAQLEAMRRSFAVIEFDPDGTILYANDDFLKTVGYTLAEIKGQHHRIFVDPNYVSSPEYHEFWARLGRGESQEGEFERINKRGESVWLQARYNALTDQTGKTYKVVKFATDISDERKWREQARDFKNQVAAINQIQGVVEYDLDGSIAKANKIFLNDFGYSLEDIKGKKHEIFVSDDEKRSPKYRQFWDDLRQGKAQSGEFERRNRDGDEVWVEARYSPLRDEDGEVYKVIEYVNDITEAVQAKFDAAQKSSIVHNAPLNIMMANRDGIIVYMNPASETTLKSLEHVLPVRANEVVGNSYDIFHKHPEHQRRMLADPRNLPHTAEIEVGGEHLRLSVSAIYDDDGEYTGPMLAWDCITDEVKKEREIKEAQERERELQEDLRIKVDTLLEAVTAAADGDLTAEVNVSGEGAIGELANGLRRMITDLRDIISQVVDGSAQFTEGARVVAESAQGVAEGAQSQSASIEQMSASIEELARSIDAVKNSAVEADKVATKTSNLAEEGGTAVKKSIEAMNRIKSSSSQISEIIQVISEIASQTNLLALNAAIEAARAGEHGMGFAVVADEVRKLAERSSEAAKEISNLIKESTQRVEEGAALSEQTGDSLMQIIEGVDGTAKRISEIAEATVEQAHNASEVSNAIQQVATVTERSAAGSEEMASSSEELGAQATAMRDLVSRFQIEKE